MIITAAGGVDPLLVAVSAARLAGFPRTEFIGIPTSAVSEIRTRVKSALTSSLGWDAASAWSLTLGLVSAPQSSAVVERTAFDLPLALALLVAQGQLPQEAVAGTLILGELALDGRVRGVRGVLPIAAACVGWGIRRLVVPEANGMEAACLGDASLEVVGVNHLTQCLEVLRGAVLPTRYYAPADCRQEAVVDTRDMFHNHRARRAMEVAAVLGCGLRLVGPPGAGKMMLARRLTTIMPPMTREERVEAAVVASVTGLIEPENPLPRSRPFRAPHHSCTAAAMVGGGPHGRVGEVSLAHRGVLFLDELEEFRLDTLIETSHALVAGEVHIASSNVVRRYPARALLVAASDPHSYARVARHIGRCLDLHVQVEKVDPRALSVSERWEDSATIRERVVNAHSRMAQQAGPLPANGHEDRVAWALACLDDDAIRTHHEDEARVLRGGGAQ